MRLKVARAIRIGTALYFIVAVLLDFYWGSSGPVEGFALLSGVLGPGCLIEMIRVGNMANFGATIVFASGAIGEAAPGRPFSYEMVFPWASVTKQAVAVMVMQDVEDGRIALDAPASRYMRELRAGPRSPTVRQLLQHRSGLRDPNDAPDFYTGGPTGIEWCLGARGSPSGERRSRWGCDVDSTDLKTITPGLRL